MTISNVPSGSQRSHKGTILYEAQSLFFRGGTGITTYTRSLVQAANRLAYDVHGIFSVERQLSKGEDRLNEILAFDAIAENEWLSPLEFVWRNIRYPFNALRGIQPIELSPSGLVVGPMAHALRPFRRVFAATRLVDASIGHFKIYGRLAHIRVPQAPSIFHATHPVPLAVKGCANVYTIHDLVPLRLPYSTLDNKRYFYRLLTSLARKADHIVTVSEHSRRDIIEHLGIDESRVTNTYQAVEVAPDLLACTNDMIAEELEKSFGLEFGKYFLFCGAIEPKKNVARLIDGYAASGSKLPLVLAGGGGWQNQVELRKIRDERFLDFRVEGNAIRRHRQIRRVDYLPYDRLIKLIQGARALLFPSIYEGFGLPVIEAMAVGTPVMTSNVSSLPEIAGDAAILVDPYSVDSIAKGIRTLEADGDLRRALVELGRKQAAKYSATAYDERVRRLYNSF